MGVRANLLALCNMAGMLDSMQVTGLPAGQLTVGSSAPSTGATTFTLSAPVPSWVAAGAPVYDVTSGALLGHVASVASSTVTMSANSLANGSVGDIVQFGFTPSDLAVGAAAGTDIRGNMTGVVLKLQEAVNLLTYLETDVITSSQDTQSNTVIAAAIAAL